MWRSKVTGKDAIDTNSVDIDDGLLFPVTKRKPSVMDTSVLTLTSLLYMDNIEPGTKLTLQNKEECAKIMSLKSPQDVIHRKRRESVRTYGLIQGNPEGKTIPKQSSIETEKISNLQEMVRKLQREKSNAESRVQYFQKEEQHTKSREELMIQKFQQELSLRNESLLVLKTNYEAQIESLKLQIQDQNKLVERMKQNTEKIQNELEKRLGSVVLSSKTMEERLNAYKSHNSSNISFSDMILKLERSEKDLEQELASKNQDLITTLKNLQDREVQVNTLTLENATLKGKLSALESELGNINSEFNAVKKRNLDIQVQYDHLLNVNVKHRRELEEINIALTEKTRSVEELQQTVLSQENQIVEKVKDDQEEQIFEQILVKIENNDKDLLDVVLTDSAYTDGHVDRVFTSLLKNSTVIKVDFSGNKKIVGNSEESICKLLLTTNTLNEMLFSNCPIQHEKVLLIKDTLKTNQSLVQCTLGLFETRNDIDEIESIMNRNFEGMYNK